jgi:hypothetical protein
MLAFLFSAPGIPSRAEAEEAGAGKVPVQIIHFERGASSMDITVVRGEKSLCSIDACPGQRLKTISAAEGNAVFQIYPPGFDESWSVSPRSGPRRFGVIATSDSLIDPSKEQR